MKKILIIPSILIIFLLALLFILLRFTNLSNYFDTQNTNAPKNTPSQPSYDIPIPDSSAQTNNNIEDGVSGGSLSSSGSSSGSTSAQTSGENCNAQSISYALKNFLTESFCNTYSGENCIDKTLTCTLDVYNLDQQVSGNFEIDFVFYDTEDEVVIATQPEEAFVEANSFVTLDSTLNLQGAQANNEISCSFVTKSVPSKETCP